MTRSRALQMLYERVAREAGHRCGYCLSRESIVGAAMEIEHLMPESLGGRTEDPCSKLSETNAVSTLPALSQLLRSARRHHQHAG